MKKKKKIFLIIALLIILTILLLFFNMNVGQIRKLVYRTLLHEEPINSETNEINNNFFGIDNTGNKICTEQINEAIKYAKDCNIKYIKLQKGTYLINGEKKYGDNKGILMQSNIVLDLNGSLIIQKDNAQPYYSVFDISNKENIKIINGTVKGDREGHDYNTINSTHQWGFGIEIKNSKNIEIRNLDIQDMTGDAIYIANKSENIDISNCQLKKCRRQGISIIEAKNVNIHQNEIYRINGNTPQSGIDLESNFETEQIENVKIYENNFYDFGSNIAIQLYRYIKNVDIYNNIITGNIICYNANQKLNIYNNNIFDGGIHIEDKYLIQELNIINNEIVNSEIYIKGAQKVKLKDNIFEKCNIETIESNIEEENNKKIN